MSSGSSVNTDVREDLPRPRPYRDRIRSALRLIEVRLRIPLVLLIVAMIIGRWDWLRNHWDRLTRLAPGGNTASQPVSNDTEYFCPMDPGVIADWPGRCGICNMALVRRKRGEAVALPDGVVARMQISPYRVQLAGIRTQPLAYLPLARRFSAAGVVRTLNGRLVVPVEISSRAAAWLPEGQPASVRCGENPGGRPMAGKLRFERGQDSAGEGEAGAIVILDDLADSAALSPGAIAEVTCEVPLAGQEPFRSMPSDPPAVKPGEPRQIYQCPEHPETRTTSPGNCPVGKNPLQLRSLSDLQRVRWWCPMHPTITSDQPGETCRPCGGMVLRARVISFRPAGMVLAVPESAVVDTGLKTVVYVETMPGSFDAVEVVLGPRCRDAYPVVSGLEPGQLVAVSGAFLLDAETRLNPSLASSYFGAAPRAAAVVEARPALAGLQPGDRAIAERQRVCPVTKKPLGSMGTPTRVVVSGRVVFLCCGGCEEAFKANPGRYIADLPAEPRP